MSNLQLTMTLIAGIFVVPAISLLCAVGAEPAKVSPTLVEIVKMHQAGVSEEVLLTYVKDHPVSKPTAEDVIYLHDAGVSKSVMMALMEKRSSPAVVTSKEPERILTKPLYSQAVTSGNASPLPPAVVETAPAVETAPVVVPAPTVQTRVYVPPPQPVVIYREPVYYPSISFGFGFGHGHHHRFGHGWHGHHHRYGHHSFSYRGGHHGHGHRR